MIGFPTLTRRSYRRRLNNSTYVRLIKRLLQIKKQEYANAKV